MLLLNVPAAALMNTTFDPSPICKKLSPATLPVNLAVSVTVKFAVPNVDAVNVVSSGKTALPVTLRCATETKLEDTVVAVTPVSPVFENTILPVLANVMSSPTDKSPTMVPEAALTSPEMSTSEAAVISPDALSVVS